MNANVNAQLQACYGAFQAGDLMRAEHHYEQIIQGHPTNTDANRLGALIAHRMGQQQIALGRINNALQADENNFETLNTKGNILKALQDMPAAVGAYRASLHIKPEYLPAAQNLGAYLINSDDPISALEVYELALRHHPDNAALQIGHVVALKDCVRNEDALGALDAMPTRENYPYERGQILLQMGEYARSIEINERALTNPATAALGFKNILQAYWMQGQWEQAVARMDTYIAKAGHSVEMYAVAARLFAKADDKSSAYAMLERATLRLGQQPELMAARARFKLEDGDMEAAYADAFKALSARPGDINIMVDYADSALATGRLTDAMTAATEALKVLPNNQYWIAIKATAMRALGQHQEYYTDPDKFVIPYELEPPEGFNDIAAYNAALKDVLNELHGLSEHPLDQSLRHGTQTTQALRFSEHPLLKAHFEALDKPIRTYMRHLGYDKNHPFLRRNTQEYLITGSWSVKLRNKGFHVSHVHPAGWISSAYYVDVPDEVSDTAKKAGWIHFGKPPFPIIGQDGKELGYEKIIQPKAGTLVLFPSYMWHGTNPLSKAASRMTLPIDAVPI